MSVDKLHRTESKFGVYDRARRIRKMVNDFLDRDFGIKVCKRDIRNAAVGKYRRLEDGSTEFYVRMPKQAEKHSRIEDYYIFMPVNGSTSENGELMVREVPEWKLEKYRDELWENAKHIAEDVRRANSIYAYYPTEYYERRKLQDMAVAHCFNLHDSLLEVAEDLPVTLEKVMPVIDEVKKEISAIKDWRKGENAVLQICMGHVEQRKRAESSRSRKTGRIRTGRKYSGWGSNRQPGHERKQKDREGNGWKSKQWITHTRTISGRRPGYGLPEQR